MGFINTQAVAVYKHANCRGFIKLQDVPVDKHANSPCYINRRVVHVL